jgi:FkbM family methyltransferase
MRAVKTIWQRGSRSESMKSQVEPAGVSLKRDDQGEQTPKDVHGSPARREKGLCRPVEKEESAGREAARSFEAMRPHRVGSISEIPVQTVTICGQPARIHGYAEDLYFQNLPAFIHELEKLRALDGTVKPKVILDIGANIGLTGILMARAAPLSTIHLVEPSPRNLDLLKRNIVNIERAMIHPVAIGSACGTASFHESLVCGAWNHVSASTQLQADGTTTVPVTTVDAMTADWPALDLIKIDVEGFEAEVLTGMHRAVERFNPVVHMELNTLTTIICADMSPRDLLRRFIALMGNVYAYNSGRLESLMDAKAQRVFLCRNLMDHGCVDDIVGCRDGSRLTGLIAT